MGTGYEELREELAGWDIEELRFGFQWELSAMTEESFDEEILSAYLDAIKEKLPPAPHVDKYESYERFRRKMLEKYGTQLPPAEKGPDK